MSLIVEDGTGVANAESYCSVAAADAYHAAFGNGDWTGVDTATKEIYLRKATRDMNLLYTFAGEQVSNTQPLDWPRTGYSTLPAALVNACAEMALLNLTVDVTGTPDGTANVEQALVKVGEIETRTTYFSPRSVSAPELRRVNLLLDPYLDPATSSGLYAPVYRG